MIYSDITSIRFCIKIYFKGAYEAIFNFDEKNYHIRDNLSANRREYREKRILEGKLENSRIDYFKSQLELSNVLDWDEHYECEFEIPDGTQWELEIESSESKLRKYGYNEFPEEWDMVKKLLEEVVRK